MHISILRTPETNFTTNLISHYISGLLQNQEGVGADVAILHRCAAISPIRGRRRSSASRDQDSDRRQNHGHEITFSNCSASD